MPIVSTTANTTGFLSNSFPHNPPRLYITAETDDFDDETLQDWRAEGFNVAYLPLNNGGKEYAQRLNSLRSVGGLGVGETFAIIAYGDAASFCLEHYARPTGAAASKLSALIAYYPSTIPDPSPNSTHFPASVQVLVHLAGSTIGVRRSQQLLGIQGKRRTLRKRVTPGLGTGGNLKIAYPTYTYADVEPGFAEHDLDEYERVAAELAWTRTLEVLKSAFRRDLEFEGVWEGNVQNKFYGPSNSKVASTVENRVSGILDSLTTHKSPHVTYTPTLTGGIGSDELRRFYADFFLPSNPPSLRLRLLSRTVGADRVVDELYIAFQHSTVMPWILPGVPPTQKWVEIVLVSIVCMRGGKLYHEHVYWDQASVLVQVGLLDPKLVPDAMRGKGVNRLPVVGAEAARRALKGAEEGEAGNELIQEWRRDVPVREKVGGSGQNGGEAKKREGPKKEVRHDEAQDEDESDDEDGDERNREESEDDYNDEEEEHEHGEEQGDVKREEEKEEADTEDDANEADVEDEADIEDEKDSMAEADVGEKEDKGKRKE